MPPPFTTGWGLGNQVSAWFHWNCRKEEMWVVFHWCLFSILLGLYFLSPLTRENSFSWNFVPVWSSGVPASLASSLGYMGDRKKAQGTHCHVVPQVLASFLPVRVFLWLFFVLCQGFLVIIITILMFLFANCNICVSYGLVSTGWYFSSLGVVFSGFYDWMPDIVSFIFWGGGLDIFIFLQIFCTLF